MSAFDFFCCVLVLAALSVLLWVWGAVVWS